MSAGKIKLGRPFGSKPAAGRGVSKQIAFRVDEETAAALKALEEREGGGHIRGHGRRSILLRRLILAAFEKCQSESDS